MRRLGGYSLAAILVVSASSSACAQVAAGNARLAAVIAGIALPDPAAPANPAHAGAGGGLTASAWIANLYGLSEIRAHGISGSFQVESFGIAVGIRSFGFDRFSDHRLSVSLSRHVDGDPEYGPRVGAELMLRRSSASGDRSRHAAFVKTGVFLPVLPRFAVGAAVERTVLAPSSSFSGPGDALSIGFSYRVFDNLILTNELRKDRFYPASLSAGFELDAGSAVSLRFGSGTNPHRLALGIALSVSRVRVHITVDHHSVLGLSSVVEVEFGS